MEQKPALPWENHRLGIKRSILPGDHVNEDRAGPKQGKQVDFESHYPTLDFESIFERRICRQLESWTYRVGHDGPLLNAISLITQYFGLYRSKLKGHRLTVLRCIRSGNAEVHGIPIKNQLKNMRRRINTHNKPMKLKFILLF